MDTEMKNEILAAIQNVNRKVDEIQKEVAKIPEMQEDITELKTDVSDLKSKTSKMQNDISELENNMSELRGNETKMQIDIRNISRSVAVIEHEHGDKLKALFDAFTTHAEAMEKQNKRIGACENKLETYDSDIYYLKTKVQGL